MSVAFARTSSGPKSTACSDIAEAPDGRARSGQCGTARYRSARPSRAPGHLGRLFTTL